VVVKLKEMKRKAVGVNPEKGRPHFWQLLWRRRQRRFHARLDGDAKRNKWSLEAAATRSYPRRQSMGTCIWCGWCKGR